MPLSAAFDAVLVPALMTLGLVMTRASGIARLSPAEVLRGAGLGNNGGGGAWEAMMTSLAATVGTANIAGAAAAVLTGGPGALFWMWVCGLLGMGIKYSEALLCVKYAEEDERGERTGGPMYCMERICGRGGRTLAVLYSAAGVLSAFVTGALWQSAVGGDMLAAFLSVPDERSAALVRGLSGAFFAISVLVVLAGGGKRTMRTAARLVPIMCCCYAAMSLVVVSVNIKRLPAALAGIARGILDPGAATCGALSGGFSAVFATAAAGMQTGTLSGEAGLGSAGVSYAAGKERDPVRAGLCGIIEVFIDTMLICTLTALCIIVSGTARYGGRDGVGAVLSAFSSVYGPCAAGAFLSFSIVMFALSSTFTWSWYGERYLNYLTHAEQWKLLYCIAFAAAVFAGPAVGSSELMPLISITNTLLMLPNFILLVKNRDAVRLETQRAILLHDNQVR